MEDIILEILDRLRAGEVLDAKDLLRILNDRNKRLNAIRAATAAPHPASIAGNGKGSEPRAYSKKRLLPFYLQTKQRDPATWRAWDVTPELEQQLVALLQVKPRRSASGVATITVITKPWKCAGNCIYCPNDLRMPKSYLADEPACQRAERNFFDPYLQVTSRLRALEQMGHVTDKIELIVLGGTWSDYPRSYQLWFMTELFRALNDAGQPSNDRAPAPCDAPVAGESDAVSCSLTAGESRADRKTLSPGDSHADRNSLADRESRARRRYYEERGLSYEKDDLVAFTRSAQQRVDVGDLSYNDAIVELYESCDPWKTLASDQRATLEQLLCEHARNERARHRVVGLVVETRPVTVTPESLAFLRTLGTTKLQMGIQSLDQHLHDINGRAVTIGQIQRALDLARLFGFKTHTHFMVNLLGATPESDKADFKRFVTETPYQPDEIKLYPCALIHGTQLCQYYETGQWKPYDEETLIDILATDVLATPAFTRISRMIRDFSAHDIEAGNKKVNLRQLVEARAERYDRAIQEIRYREISTQDVEVGELALEVIPYETISTHEHFLQWLTPENKIAGFLRLSLPKPEAFTRYSVVSSNDVDMAQLPVLPDEAMIREVHVYGRASSLHAQGSSAQHRGLGKKLIERACAIAREAGYAKINVISAIGTREYYRGLGFTDHGLYQQRSLSAE